MLEIIAKNSEKFTKDYGKRIFAKDEGIEVDLQINNLADFK